MPKNAEPILGLDPGYDRLGWAVGTPTGQQWPSLQYGLIQTPKSTSQANRYQQLANELSDIIKRFQPKIAAIEQLFFAKNRSSALKVSEARGVILKVCSDHGLKIVEFAPNQIKQAVTGYGRADKKSVEKMVRLQMKLPNQPIGDDTIDALAAMLTCQAHRKILDLTAVV